MKHGLVSTLLLCYFDDIIFLFMVDGQLSIQHGIQFGQFYHLVFELHVISVDVFSVLHKTQLFCPDPAAIQVV